MGLQTRYSKWKRFVIKDADRSKALTAIGSIIAYYNGGTDEMESALLMLNILLCEPYLPEKEVVRIADHAHSIIRESFPRGSRGVF